MFLTTTKSGYKRDGEQFAHGLFLVLMTLDMDQPDYRVDGRLRIKAMVRHVRMHQCGHFMMARLKVDGTTIPLSGAYGGDGLTRTVPRDVFDRHGVELPAALYQAWNKGDGWNSAGTEAPDMRTWALENLKTLRK